MYKRQVNNIRVIDTLHRHIGGDNHNIKIIDLAEFCFFGLSSTGHTGEQIIHTEIILEGNSGQGLVFTFDFDLFFGLDRLMQAITVAAAEHQAAGELIDDDDLIILDHIVAVAFKNELGFERLIDIVRGFCILRIIEVFDPQSLFYFSHAFFSAVSYTHLDVYKRQSL